jgi:DNA-binding NarL/FixJ family response regulator
MIKVMLVDDEDYCLPDGLGTVAARMIREHNPATKVVMLTGFHRQEWFCRRCDLGSACSLGRRRADPTCHAQPSAAQAASRLPPTRCGSP